MVKPRSISLSVDALEDRLTPAGELDVNFGNGGVALISHSEPASVSAAAALPDGSVLVAGWANVNSVRQFAVAKLRPDGSADTTFGTNGLATVAFSQGGTIFNPGFNSQVTAVAVQPDGRIVLAGVVFGNRITENGVARLLPNGQLDASFGTDGKLILLTGELSSTNAVAVQPDGRIVLAGALTPFGGTSLDFLAIRLLSNGAFDTGFSDDGRVTIPFDLGASMADAANGVALQRDGGIVLVGNATTGTLTPEDIQQDIAIVRLTAAGGLDSTFDGDGKRTLSLNRIESAAAVAVRPDGRILVGGRTGSATYLHGLGGASFDYVVAQYFADGSVDQSFGNVGRAIIPIPDISPATPDQENRLTGLALQSTGKIVVTGHGYLVSTARLTATGQLDATFGTGGLVSDAPSGAGAEAVLAAPLGRIVLAGTRTEASPTLTSTVTVVRLQGDPIGPSTIDVGGRADGTATLFSPRSGRYEAVDSLAHFPGFAGDVRTAVADVTGDGVPDFIGGAGPGGGPQFVITDGKSGGRVAGAEVFESTFTGGVFVAAADLDGDGKAEVIATPDRGGGPIVAIYSGAKLTAGLNDDAAQLVRFFGIADEAFRGGARPAVGDLDGDGTPDLVVAAGFLGGPRVALFNGKAVVTRISEINAASGRPANSFRLVGDFFAFEESLRNGAFAAAADFTGDGKADLAFGGGPGGAGRVRIVDGARLLASPPRSLDDPSAGGLQVANFFAGDSSLRGGVHLAARDVSGDGRADLVAGSGEGEPSRVRVYLSSTLLGDTTPDPDQQFDPYGAAVPLGVFVG